MTQEIPFSNKPGKNERHLKRRINNPLFERNIQNFNDEMLLEAQKADHEELIAYVDSLRALVSKAVQLKPNEGSDVILLLKEELDKSYDKSCTIADEQGSNQQAILQLIGIIMNTVRQAAGNDTQAQQELADEDIARKAHHEMLESSLVADLLDPDSLIAENELSAVILSANEEDIDAALKLFDNTQLMAIIEDAEKLIRNTPDLTPELQQTVINNVQKLKACANEYTQMA